MTATEEKTKELTVALEGLRSRLRIPRLSMDR